MSGHARGELRPASAPQGRARPCRRPRCPPAPRADGRPSSPPLRRRRTPRRQAGASRVSCPSRAGARRVGGHEGEKCCLASQAGRRSLSRSKNLKIQVFLTNSRTQRSSSSSSTAHSSSPPLTSLHPAHSLPPAVMDAASPQQQRTLDLSTLSTRDLDGLHKSTLKVRASARPGAVAARAALWRPCTLLIAAYAWSLTL